MDQTVKTLPAMKETWVQFLGREDPPEKGMDTHSTILTWKIPWIQQSYLLYTEDFKTMHLEAFIFVH